MREKIFDSLGFRLVQLRKSRHLTQVEFAEKVGTNVSVIRRFEGNISMPAAETLIAIQDAFGCNLHWLLTGQGTMLFGTNEGDQERTVNHPSLVEVDRTLTELDKLDAEKSKSLLLEFRSRAREVKRVAELESMMMRLNDKI